MARMVLEVASIKNKFWDIVGNDVCKSVMQFFESGWLMPNMNSHLVLLILKVPSADKIEDLRPIALTNFQFKIISKVLDNRLASIAPKIIRNQQKGFIKTSISSNAFVLHLKQ